jgi:hypothetical protein
LRFNFKKHFDIWEDKPTTIVERKMKWHFSHLPSLHQYLDKVVFISKSVSDHTQIVGLIYEESEIGKNPLVQFQIGSNEGKFLTDCVFREISDGFVVALNKRTKASEPYISEIVQYAAKSFKVLGRAIRNHTTVRHIE